MKNFCIACGKESKRKARVGFCRKRTGEKLVMTVCRNCGLDTMMYDTGIIVVRAKPRGVSGVESPRVWDVIPEGTLLVMSSEEI
jgi:hypothetical protein